MTPTLRPRQKYYAPPVDREIEVIRYGRGSSVDTFGHATPEQRLDNFIDRIVDNVARLPAFQWMERAMSQPARYSKPKAATAPPPAKPKLQPTSKPQPAPRPQQLPKRAPKRNAPKAIRYSRAFDAQQIAEVSNVDPLRYARLQAMATDRSLKYAKRQQAVDTAHRAYAEHNQTRAEICREAARRAMRNQSSFDRELATLEAETGNIAIPFPRSTAVR